MQNNVAVLSVLT